MAPSYICHRTTIHFMKSKKKHGGGSKENDNSHDSNKSGKSVVVLWYDTIYSIKQSWKMIGKNGNDDLNGPILSKK